MSSRGENPPPKIFPCSAKTLRALGRVADLGATAQASVPGAYAWSVTVAPLAFASNSPIVARAAATVGVLSLGAAVAIERHRPAAARVVSVWGLVSSSLLVWTVVPTTLLSPVRIDILRGMAGVLGWGLFAMASAAPALERTGRVSSAGISSRPLRSRGEVGWGDAAILWAGFAMAGVTQTVGWRVIEPERAVLVRLLGLAGGLAAISTAASLVAARQTARTFDSPRRRARRALVPLVFFGLLSAGGVLVTLASWR